MLTHLSKQISIALKTVLVFISAICLCTFLSGCSGSSDDSKAGSTKEGNTQQDTGQEEPVKGELNTPIKVSSKFGDLEVTIEGFDISEKMTNQFSDDVSEGQKTGVLKMIVKNDSIDTNQIDGIPLYEAVYVNGEDGVSLTVLSSSIDYGKYEGCAGGYVDSIQQGQSKRVAFLYPVDANTENVEVNVKGTVVSVPVEQAE